MGKDLADIRSNVSTAVDTINGIKVRGKIISVGVDPENDESLVVTIRIPSKKRKESGNDPHPSFSYSIPKRLAKDLEVGKEVVITLTPQ